MSDTSKYKAPKFAVKPAPGDTGYDLVSKSYRRFIWTWNDYANKKPDTANNESDTFTVYQGEISGFGAGNEITGGTVGYGGPLKNNNFMPTDSYMDPDKKKSKILSYEDFESEESEDGKEED